jgi:protein gp37
MGTNSKIEWTTHTFNPWRGCAKVSAGCDNCYAERQSKRNQTLLGEWGPDGRRAMAASNYWALPNRWNRAAEKTGTRQRVFCGSLCDVFELREDLEGLRMRLLRLIVDTPNLDWLLLTKRPENYCEAMRLGYQDGLPPNLWLGVSVENQAAADVRIPLLLQCPAAIRFLSCEPLLGPVDLTNVVVPEDCDRLNRSGLDPSKFNALSVEYDDVHYHQPPASIGWVIAGGESGPNARPSHPDWFRSLRDQCAAAGVPFFFKQWGEFVYGDQLPDNCRTELMEIDEARVYRFGKKATGHLLDGREHKDFPGNAP